MPAEAFRISPYSSVPAPSLPVLLSVSSVSFHVTPYWLSAFIVVAGQQRTLRLCIKSCCIRTSLYLWACALPLGLHATSSSKRDTWVSVEGLLAASCAASSKLLFCQWSRFLSLALQRCACHGMVIYALICGFSSCRSCSRGGQSVIYRSRKGGRLPCPWSGRSR